MLVSPKQNRRNRTAAWCIASALAATVLTLAYLSSPAWLTALPLAPLLGWLLRRKTARRWTAQNQTFPDTYRAILQRDVEYYRALATDARQRFERLMQVFLSEVRITGIGTQVDAETRTLVAASAIIPIFGFDHWEYSRLGEVLIYPQAFNEHYRQADANGPRTLGMVGQGHLNGVMILSKPDLLSGFRNPADKRNVGLHEFAHLVDREDGVIDGLPPGVSQEVAQPWIAWVAQELQSEGKPGHHIDDYAYTNPAEYFAVLSEYFFESPALLQQKAPETYRRLAAMYHQQTSSLLSSVSRRPRRVGRNAPCPCGSGKKYKHCCRPRATAVIP